MKPFSLSLHVPPLKQGCDAHSSVSFSQRRPLKPGVHVQEKLPGMSELHSVNITKDINSKL